MQQMDAGTLITLVTILVSGIGMILGAILPAIVEGRAVLKALEGMTRQPEAAGDLRNTLVVAMALLLYRHGVLNYLDSGLFTLTVDRNLRKTVSWLIPLMYGDLLKYSVVMMQVVLQDSQQVVIQLKYSRMIKVLQRKQNKATANYLNN